MGDNDIFLKKPIPFSGNQLLHFLRKFRSFKFHKLFGMYMIKKETLRYFAGTHRLQ